MLRHMPTGTGLSIWATKNFFPYLATGRRPVARLFCTVLCTCTKSTKQGLADDGKIGFCVILPKNRVSDFQMRARPLPQLHERLAEDHVPH